MTAKASLCKALLDGVTINCGNIHNLVGFTNASREIIRMVEQPFGVKCNREEVISKSRYGSTVQFINYRLYNTILNREGIKKMREYVAKESNGGSDFVKQSTKQLEQQTLFL